MNFLSKLLILCLLITVSTTIADVILVPSGVSTLREAINQANDGDLIYVSPNADGTPHKIKAVYVAGTDQVPDGEGIDFGTKNLKIVSAYKDDPTRVVIDLGGQTRAFKIAGGQNAVGTLIKGFTFINGFAAKRGLSPVPDSSSVLDLIDGTPGDHWATPSPTDVQADNGGNVTGDSYGGAIEVSGTSSITIENCIFRNCVVSGPIGGNGVDGEDVDPADSEASSKNGAWGGDGGDADGNGLGGAVAFNGTGHSFVVNCTFENNTAKGATGGNGGKGGDATANGYYESAGGRGGAADGDGKGGAIYVGTNAEATFINSSFKKNKTMYAVGGRKGENGFGQPFNGDHPGPDPAYPEYGFVYGANDTTDPAFTRNAKGGAIFSKGTLNLIDCDIEDNEAVDDGGAIFNADSSKLYIIPRKVDGAILGSHITGNNSGVVTNPIYSRNTVASGGAVSLKDSCQTAMLNTDFRENAAPFSSEVARGLGGAVKIDLSVTTADNATLSAQLNHIILDANAVGLTSLTNLPITLNELYGATDASEAEGLYRCSFNSNSAYKGGALYVGETTTLTLKDSTFGNNSAVLDGGAVYSIGSKNLANVITFDTCSFSNNSATNGSGGAIYGYALEATINDCVINSNTAFSSGGALKLLYKGSNQSVINSSTFLYNKVTAESGVGGAISMSNNSPSFRDSIFTSNETTGTLSSGGALHVAGSNPTIINCQIDKNISVLNGAGINFAFYSTGIINNTTFADNTLNALRDELGVDGSGSAIYALDNDILGEGKKIDVKNSVFTSNNGIAVVEGDASDIDCTNCLFFDNFIYSESEATKGNFATYIEASGTLDVHNTAAEINAVADNVSNIVVDDSSATPVFQSGPLGLYYMASASPAIDAGSEASSVNGLDSAGYTIYPDATGDVPGATVDAGVVDLGYHNKKFGNLAGVTISIINPEHGDLIVTNSATGDKLYDSTDPVTYPNSEFTTYAGAMIRLVVHPDSGWRVASWSGTSGDASIEKENFAVVNYARTISVNLELPRTIHFPSEYNTLQEAVDAARDGDVIVIAPQPYPYHPVGEIYIDGKAITITGSKPDDPSVVDMTVLELHVGDSGGAHPAFIIENCDRDTVLSGFKIQGYGRIGTAGSTPPGAGSPGTDGVGVVGGAFILYNASPTIKNINIENGTIVGGRGGNGQTGDSVRHGGHGGWAGFAYGGGIACLGSSSPLIENCEFRNLIAKGGNHGDGGDGNSGSIGGLGAGWYYVEEGDESIYQRYYADYPEEFIANTDAFYNWEFVWPHETPTLGGRRYGPYQQYTGRGGAVYIGSSSAPTFKRCTFENCTSKSGLSGKCGINSGSGLRGVPSDNYTIDNVGGAVYCETNSTATFERCDFISNKAEVDTSYNNDDQFVSYGGAIYCETGSTLSVTNCNFRDNESTVGGAVFGRNSTETFVDTSFTNNRAYIGGALNVTDSTLKMSRVDLLQNSASSEIANPTDENPQSPLGHMGSGGGMFSWGNDADLYDLTVIGNSAQVAGGGLFFGGENFPIVTNVLVANNNSSVDGGGIAANWYSQLKLVNATIADNSTVSSGGGLYAAYLSNVEVVSSIVWGNAAGMGSQISAETGFEGTSLPSEVHVSYSDVQNGLSGCYQDLGEPGTDDDSHIYLSIDDHNLSGASASNPYFTAGEYGNYYLRSNADAQTPTSACIDAGLTDSNIVSFYRHTTRTDHALEDAIYDMGFHYILKTDLVGDLDYDNDVDYNDYFTIFSNWLDHDCSFPYWCDGTDFNQDGRVNLYDEDVIRVTFGDDETPPSPNPMSWQQQPYSASATSVGMEASLAIDNSGAEVWYEFEGYGVIPSTDPSDPNGFEIDLAETVVPKLTLPPQIETAAVFEDLDAHQQYAFRVRASDIRTIVVGQNPTVEKPIYNPTGWSQWGFVTVGEDNTPPDPNVMSWASAPALVSGADPAQITMTATTASDPSGVEYYFSCTAGGAADSGWQDSSTYICSQMVDGSNLAVDTTYTFKVKARDKSDSQNPTGSSEPMSVDVPHNPGAGPIPSAPTIVEGWEYDNAASWHHVVGLTDSIDDSGIVYYAFECDELGYTTAFIKAGDPQVTTSTYTLKFEGENVVVDFKVSPYAAPDFVYKWRVVVRDDDYNYNYSNWLIVQ